MPKKTNKNRERILVSLDFDDGGSSFLESLVMLASKLDAELCGLFVEDSELQQIANLPFSREITFLTAHTRELNSGQIARHLKQHAETLQKMMQDLSRLSNVACTFKTTRGPRIESVLTESYDFQVVVFLPEKYSARRAKRNVSLDQVINPTVIFYDASDQAKKSAFIVQSLVEKGDLHQLKILTLDKDLESRAQKQLAFGNVKTEYQHIESYNISTIIPLIKSQKTGLLILPLEDELIGQSQQIRKLLEIIECPLLLVK